MKAVVVEIKGKHMVVMDQQGCFHQMKYNKTSGLGDEILMPGSTKAGKLIYFRKLAAVAAVLLVVAGTGYGVSSYYTPYTYVDIDINPSLELVLNRYSRVLDVECLNEDAGRIAPRPSEFKNKKASIAVEQLLENARKEKIISEDNENALLFTVSGKNDSSVTRINHDLEKAARNRLTKMKVKCEVLPPEKVTLNKREEARKKKVSPGRIILYERLKELKPDTEIEDVQKMTVRDTLKLIKEYRKAKKDKEGPTQIRETEKPDNTDRNVKNTNEDLQKRGENPVKNRINKDKSSNDNIRNTNENRESIRQNIKQKIMENRKDISDYKSRSQNSIQNNTDRAKNIKRRINNLLQNKDGVTKEGKRTDVEITPGSKNTEG